MSVVAGSRYERQPIYRIPLPSWERRLAIYHQGFYPTRFGFDSHMVQEGERLDDLAARYLNDPRLWWIIAAVNPHVFYPDNIEPGTTLRIPRA